MKIRLNFGFFMVKKWENIRTFLGYNFSCPIFYTCPRSIQLSLLFTSDLASIFISASTSMFTSDLANMFTSTLANMFTSALVNMFTSA